MGVALGERSLGLLSSGDEQVIASVQEALGHSFDFITPFKGGSQHSAVLSARDAAKVEPGENGFTYRVGLAFMEMGEGRRYADVTVEYSRPPNIMVAEQHASEIKTIITDALRI